MYSREAKYRVIYQKRKGYGIGEMCKFLQVSRAAYYAWIQRMDKPDVDEEKMKLIQMAYLGSRRPMDIAASRCGYPGKGVKASIPRLF